MNFTVRHKRALGASIVGMIMGLWLGFPWGIAAAVLVTVALLWLFGPE